VTLRVLAFVVVFVSLCASGAAAPLEGRLCFGDSCRDARCGQAVEPQPEARPFTLAARSGRSYVLGIQQPGTRALACATDAGIELTFAARNLPRKETLRLTIRNDAGVEWPMSLSVQTITRPVALMLAQGDYDVAVATPHHVTFRARLQVRTSVQRVAVVLQPMPRLSGIVSDSESRRPIPNAAVLIDGTDQRALTDAKGRYTFEADPERWPKLVTVAAEGYGEASLFVPRARRTAELDDIRLTRGASIAVQLEQTSSGEVVAVDLIRLHARGRSVDGVVKTLAVPSMDASTSVRFTDVAPGDYVVLAKGDGPCERYGERVTVTAGDELKTTLPIRPFRLHSRVEAEGAPVAGARVRFKQRDLHWEGSFVTGKDGEATVTMWQGGRISSTVLLETAEMVPYRERRTIGEGEDTAWHIQVPSREIVGVVVDAITGDVIPRATVALTMTPGEGGGFVVSTEAGDDGTFRFSPVAHGAIELKGAAPGYPERQLSFTFQEPEQSRHVALELRPAAVTTLQVIDSRGGTVAGARVINCRGIDRAGMSNTDASGKVPVLVPEGEMHDLWVIPRNGSLATMQLTSGTEEATIRVPDANCRIVLQTESESGTPIAGIFIVMRYEGRVVPPDVMDALSIIHGARVRSDSGGRVTLDHMPPGSYEFWPLLSEAELRLAASGAGPQAPVRMRVVPGENVAVLTFADREAERHLSY
jgi:hypothetical protein